MLKKPIPAAAVSKDLKAQSFGTLIEAYSKGRKPYPKEVYDLILQYVPSSESVLDLGCGTGLSTLPLFSLFNEVRGLDHDPTMLKIAKTTCGHPGHFDEGSAYDLPYEDQRFGLITMFLSFHWFSDENALLEIKRVLKNRGTICIVHGNLRPLNKECEDIINRALAYRSLLWEDDYNPLDLLSRKGFNLLTHQKTLHTYHYTKEEALYRFQSSSCWNDVRKADKEQEVLIALKSLCDEKADAQGIIHHPETISTLIAQSSY